MSPRQTILNGQKSCTRCMEWKPLTDFVEDKRTSTGRTSRCKTCIYEINLTRYHTNEEFRNKSKHQKWVSALKNKYNLTEDQFNALLKHQDNKCAVCLNEINRTDVTKLIHVDHCHFTGVVRGLLCYTCNIGIGYFKDNSSLLNSAASYLKRFE